GQGPQLGDVVQLGPQDAGLGPVQVVLEDLGGDVLRVLALVAAHGALDLLAPRVEHVRAGPAGGHGHAAGGDQHAGQVPGRGRGDGGDRGVRQVRHHPALGVVGVLVAFGLVVVAGALDVLDDQPGRLVGTDRAGTVGGLLDRDGDPHRVPAEAGTAGLLPHLDVHVHRD